MRRKDGRAEKQIYNLTEKQRLEIRHTTSDDLTGRQGCCTRGPGKKTGGNNQNYQEGDEAVRETGKRLQTDSIKAKSKPK